MYLGKQIEVLMHLLEWAVICKAFVIFDYPPFDAIATLVSADKNGETFCRHVANLAILAV